MMSENESNKKSPVTRLGDAVRAYFALLIEDTKLNVTEKMTRLLSAVAVCSLLTILVTAALVFLSISAGLALTAVMSPLWAFISVAGLYILLIAVLLFFRTKLIVNPIARFISRLILDAPKNPEVTNDNPAPIS